MTLFLPAAAQDGKSREDSLVRLVKASSLRLIEQSGQKFRKAVDATFLHNGTYLICDTALWNVDKQVINSEGHVQIIQDETLLTSDKLDYYIDRDLAEFRGGVVQLTDKDGNILRTRNLDYNTKDSVAVFRNGAAMRDKDGQIIESDDGKYDSKSSEFFFNNRVNMFTDSIFVKTERLVYEGNTSIARFESPIDFWKDGNMLSASRGWYKREVETFFFTGNVHGLSENQETWSDSLYFYRNSSNVKLLGNAQIQDTTRNVSAVAQYLLYEDSLARVTLWNDAAVALKTEEENKPVDTLYFGADTLVYETIRRCDIPEDELKAAEERLFDMNTDPVREYRQKAAKEAEEAARQAAEQAGNLPLQGRKKVSEIAKSDTVSTAPAELEAGKVLGADSLPAPESLAAVADTVAAPADSLPAAADSLSAQLDSLALLSPPDTTKIDFLRGVGNVKVFRQDIQVSCDSMRYCALDSIARFYIDPIVWNEGNRQYTSDSLFVLVKNGAADRANLLSNAFIITQEDSVCFDQIKATEVMAYFDTTATLRRFDALGGASALFYLEEKETLATVNKVESKMLSAVFKAGEIDRVYYFDQPHNDAYPVAQMLREDRFMKGFNWMPDKRPGGKSDITDLKVRRSERAFYESKPKTSFPETDRYFPGYMQGVYKTIAERDSIKALPKAAKPVEAGQEFFADSLQFDDAPIVDSLLVAVKDSLSTPVDSLSTIAPADSLAIKKDTLDTTGMSEKEIKAAMRKRDAEARARARMEAREKAKAVREARIAELDARDAAREEAKAAKQALRRRAATRRVLEARDAKAAKELARLEKYKRQYEKRKAREDARKARRSARQTGTQLPETADGASPVPDSQNVGPAVTTQSETATVAGNLTETSAANASPAASEKPEAKRSGPASPKLENAATDNLKK